MTWVFAEVNVEASPLTAFELFTAHVDQWWRRGERYGGPDVVGHRFDCFVGGRFVEVLSSGEAELGTITCWDPPWRLAFTWRQGRWRPEERTDVEVTFTPSGVGTRVRLEHRGFEDVTSDVGCDVGYRAGWTELLGWLRESALVKQGEEHAREPLDHAAESRP